MKETLTIAEIFESAGFSDAQAAALTRAIEAFTRAALDDFEDNEQESRRRHRSQHRGAQGGTPDDPHGRRKVRADYEKSRADFETTIREQPRWLAAINFSAGALAVAATGSLIHLK